MEPPPCIQNAMMTKDKKPFTYTPGGLNLSEIRSPRMARRIERNAAYEGVGTPPPSQNNRPHIPTSSLPPSTLAAMQPQMHVQVFPTGPPPPPPMNNLRGAISPLPPCGVPPPPPPPTQPLPTQKFQTGDHQEVERPDMTKIIPENPMALLRKTAGPKIKNTLLDEMYREPTRGAQQQPQITSADYVRTPPPISNPSFGKQTRPALGPSLPPNQTQQISQLQNTPVQQQQQRSPPIIERNEPPRNPRQQTQNAQHPERNVNIGSIYIPPLNNQHSKNMASPSSPQSPNVQTPGTPTLKEAPKPWQQKQQVKPEEVPEWAKREPNLTQSPVVQELQINQNQQQPRWPQCNQPSPAVTYQHKEPELVYRNKQQSHVYVVPQQKPETQHKFQPTPQNQPDPDVQPNAVFVTQPIVLQHPGSGYGPPVVNRRENVTVSKQEGGAKIIPIRVEGAESPPNRNSGRQPSWSNNPTTSGTSSKTIQKMTANDELNFDSVPERRLPQEEMRKMQLNNSDQDLLNRFKQEGNFYEENPRYRGGHIPSKVFRILDQSDVDSEEFSHRRSSDPRYMGAAIPSKAFRILQHMTYESKGQTHVPSDAGRNQPNVRNIPIQIEGNGAATAQCYVPPSQQTPAEEPKKYTGSSIPSRSFKMLQAMTAHDSCANAKEANRTNYDFPYYGGNWAYPPPAYPMCPIPSYWPPYYPLNSHEYSTTERSDSDPDLIKPEMKKCAQPFWGFQASTPIQELDMKNGTGRRTSLPFSNSSSSSELETINARKTPVPQCYPGRSTPVPGRRTPKSYADSEQDSNRTTPIAFWAGYPHLRDTPEVEESRQDGYGYYPLYPPYFDPYYMSYYYGYPPIFPPAPLMYPNSESEDLNGYSSMDEMSYYNQKGSHFTCEDANQEAPTITPLIVVTPTPKEGEDILANKQEILSSDSDTDTEVNEETTKRSASSGGLQTIKSVKDVNVYMQYEQDSEQSDDEIEDGDDSETSSDSSVYAVEEEDEVIPHQLSVIFEVSERTDISRNVRECSVTSDCTTVGAKSDEENDDDDPANKEWISDNLMEIAIRIQSRINARIELDDLENNRISSPENSLRKLELTCGEGDIINHCQSQKELSIESTLFQTNLQVTDNCQHFPKAKKIGRCKFYSEMESKPENFMQENVTQNLERSNMSDKNVEDENCSKAIREVNDNPEAGDNSKESSDSEDWWGVIGNKDDDFVVRKTYSYKRDSMYCEEMENDTEENMDSAIIAPLNLNKTSDTVEERSENYVIDANLTEGENPQCKEADDNVSGTFWREPSQDQKINVKLVTTSAHSSDSSGDWRKDLFNVDSAPELQSDQSSESEESEDSSNEDEEETTHDVNNNDQDDKETVVQVPSIKDRIKALQASISAKKKSLRVDEELKICVKSQVIAIDLGEATRSKTISAKSSVKSFDEISEEDSGVTDMSRQFSDNEEFPELKKMTRYQRASTHSRLFQLLQGECENDEDFVMEERKGQLTLPLNVSVSDELADELVQSMLKQKKGHIFRNVSMEKLHAAAKKILQEDNSADNSTDTPSEGFSEFLSPLRNDTGNSTPQEFYGHYNEYLQYYDSWAQASQDDFKSSRTFCSCLTKCPRVLSGKNVHSDLMRLAATPEEPSLLPETKS